MKFPRERTRKLLSGYPHAPITLHTEEDFEQMAIIGRIAAETLDHITAFIKPGISTAALDEEIDCFIRSKGAVAATIGYHGYQHASCISVNHVAVHGVPRADKILKSGDMLNIDVTPKLNGWHGDTSRMYTVGDKIPVKASRLIEAVEHALAYALKQVRPGMTLNHIGQACEEIARQNGYSISTQFCGHGIGLEFHDSPQILHEVIEGPSCVLHPGMIFTIEPIFNAGRPETKILDDGWTAVTRDRSLSAQVEHTVGVTESDPVIFTQSPAAGV